MGLKSLLGLVAVLLFAAAAPADTIAYANNAQTTGNQTNQNTALGMDFQVNDPIEITQMGAFNSGQAGFASNVEVGIFSDSTETEIPGTDVVFTPIDGANPGMLVGNNRFETLATPVTLDPGTYSIVYFNGSSNSEMFFNFMHSNGSNGGGTGGGLISFVGDSRYGGGSSIFFPTTIDGSGGNSTINYEAGTFAFVTAPVPEPSSLALLGIGAIGLFLCVRRRRIALG